MGQYLKNLPTRNGRNKQRGAVLFIALIALVAMTLAGIALMRSVDTANVIAGNFAFKESTLHASDGAVGAAFNALPALAAAGNVAVANQYFPVIQPLDAQGVPTTVNWNAVPSTAVAGTGNRFQYVIERMCQDGTATGPPPNNAGLISASCITVPTASTTSGSKKSGGVTFTGSGVVYYRVTVRVTGPHGAVSMVQGTISL